MSPFKSDLKHGLLLGWTSSRSKIMEPVWDEEDEGHLITLAPTGAGKGVSSIIPALLTWQGPAIVVDPKGEAFAVTAQRRAAMGQKVYVLDPFSITGAAPARLNPLDFLSPSSPSLEDDAAVLAELICQLKAFTNIDPFWDERATEMVRQAILIVMEDPPSDRTMTRVRDILMCEIDETDRQTGHSVFTAGFGTSRTRTSINATVASHLSFLRYGPVLRCLENSTVNLADIRSGVPLTLYLVLPANKLSSHGRLLRLWLGIVLGIIARRTCLPPIPTLLLIDEAAQLGEVAQLRTAITLLRGYGVRVWSFWQDLAQLMRCYRDWESLLNNCATQQIFGATNPRALSQVRDYLSGSLTSPLATLRSDETVLIRPRHRPAVIGRSNYLTDRMFQDHYAPNPFHRRRADPQLDFSFGHAPELQPELPFQRPTPSKVLRFPAGGTR